jgi:hypothetical protein
VQAIPLTVDCPSCGSSAVVYSCDPHCCFNHVCAECRASFFLTTRFLGDARAELGAEPARAARADPTAPTAPCDRCGGIQLWSLADDDAPGDGAGVGIRRGLCAECGAMLAIEIAAEAP